MSNPWTGNIRFGKSKSSRSRHCDEASAIFLVGIFRRNQADENQTVLFFVDKRIDRLFEGFS